MTPAVEYLQVNHNTEVDDLLEDKELKACENMKDDQNNEEENNDEENVQFNHDGDT